MSELRTRSVILKRLTITAFAALIIIGIGLVVVGLIYRHVPPLPLRFDSDRAYQDVLVQSDLGPRLPGSAAHDQVQGYIRQQLEPHGWHVELQSGVSMGHEITNIIAKRGSGKPWIILGAHYDSRMIADSDPDPANHVLPVPGANDGASGVAVLLELGRVLPQSINKTLWLVFFDAEDQGSIPGWNWILGSRYFVDYLTKTPDSVVIVDMVGDSDLNIFYEASSNETLREEIWTTAASLGYGSAFNPQVKHSILDDHTPFLEKGIPAIDIIDFDYPYWHTIQDTPDKVSPVSLKIVGDTLLEWLTTP